MKIIPCDYTATKLRVASMLAAASRCLHCDGTGDVHDLPGNWRGRCTCPAGRQLAPWTPTDLAVGRAPCDGNAWVDVKLRTGAIHYRARAYTWAWGEAGDGTITYWRMSRAD